MATREMPSAGAAWLANSRSAHAVKDVTLTGGRLVEAWEFDVPLRVVSLRGSVPAQWTADFQAAAGKHSRVQLQQRLQLQEIYDELSQHEYGLSPTPT